MLSHEQARAFYDRFGAKQDWQRFYEDPSLDELTAHLDLGEAQSVVEFGCGTGRLAACLLEECLPAHARYLGLDVSSTMVGLARDRLVRFGDRAEIRLTNGGLRLPLESESADRLVSTYVLDLLGEEDIRTLIAEAHRVLRPGGLIGLVSLTHGCTVGSRFFECLWTALHRVRPSLVGGCRPIALLRFVGEGWEVRYHRTLVRYAVPSEVLVAQRL